MAVASSVAGLVAQESSSTRRWYAAARERRAVTTTPLPAAKAYAEDERSVLLGYLAYHRAVLARKVDGLTDEQARRATCPPSDLTLLGLVRHMAEVERMWFRQALSGEDVGPIFAGAAHPDGDEDGDLHPPPDATLAAARDAYWAEIAVA